MKFFNEENRVLWQYTYQNTTSDLSIGANKNVTISGSHNIITNGKPLLFLSSATGHVTKNMWDIWLYIDEHPYKISSEGNQNFYCVSGFHIFDTIERGEHTIEVKLASVGDGVATLDRFQLNRFILIEL